MKHRQAEIAFLILLFASSPAVAQNPAVLKAAKDQVRALYERGTAEYRLGYFDKAAALYEEAYRVLPDPALLYNIGQAYRKAGQSDKALVGYRSFVRTAPAGLPNLDLARKWIAEIETGLNPAGNSADADAAMAPQVPFATLAEAPAPSATPAALNLSTTDASSEHPKSRWWIWSAAGALVVG